MAQRFNTCFIDTNGADVSQQFVDKQYLIDVYPSLINPSKAPALWLWGASSYGQLGTNSTTFRSSPVQTISSGTNWEQIDFGGNNAAGIKTDGSLWMWGPNGNGILGNNNTTGASSPVQTVSAGTNWKQVSIGYNFSSAIKTDGSLWLWGTGSGGALGNNSAVDRSSPVQTVSAGTNWKQVSAGSGTVAAIKSNNSLWLWGSGAPGNLGQSTTVASQSSPVQTVSAGTNWRQVSTGRCHTVAIKTDGTLWTWGCNFFGELGNNASVPVSSPVQTVSGGTNWKKVSGGDGLSAAVKTDGSLWLWGNGFAGALGNNSSTVSNRRSSPVQTVTGGYNWKDVSVSKIAITNGSATAAIKTDGSLWLMGCGACGALGTSSVVNRSSPVQTVSAGTNWKSTVTSNMVSMAIREVGDW